MNTSIRFPNLNIDLDFVGQAVSVRGFEINIFSLLVTVGMLLGLMVMIVISKAKKENPNLCLETAIFALAGGVLGARILYVGFHWGQFAGKSAAGMLDFRKGGMYFYGGILGAVILGSLFCKVRRISFSKMADIVSMGFLSVQIIAAWGSFFNREGFGEYTDSFFAMQLPVEAVDSDVITELMKANLVENGGVSFIQVHPLFLYESLWCLLLFVVLLFYTWRKKFDGEIFLRYLAGYSLGMAVTEWLDPQAPRIPGINIPVFLPVCVLLFVIFATVAAVRRAMTKKREERKIRKEEEWKRAALLQENTIENEGSDYAETDKAHDEEAAAGHGAAENDQQEKTEAKNTQVPAEAERDAGEQDRHTEKSENKPEAGSAD